MSLWIAGGTVVAGVGSALINKNKGDPNRAYNTQLGTDSMDAINRSRTIADRPYVPYTKDRVAGLSGNEVNALDLAGKSGKKTGEYLDKAGNVIDNVADQEWNADTASKWMDPYVGGVVDQTLKRENTAYQQNQNTLRGNAAKQNAFGGDRATLLEAASTGKHLQAVGDITAEGYSKAYQNAFQNWQGDNDRKLRAAQAYDSVGGDIQRMESGQIEDLMKTGNADRVLRQLTNDADYSAFVEQRDWSANNIKPLLSAISSARGGNISTEGTNSSGALLGSIASLVGYFGKNYSGGGSVGPSATNGKSNYTSTGAYMGAYDGD